MKKLIIILILLTIIPLAYLSYIANNKNADQESPKVLLDTPGQKQTSPAKKKNIILITMDTVRADHLSYMGYPRKTTPFLEDLAKKGVLFENTFTRAPITEMAHASIFTGLYSNNNIYSTRFNLKDFDNSNKTLGEYLELEKIADSDETITEYLKNENYQTGGFVSSNALLNFNLEQGFDIYNKSSDENYPQNTNAPSPYDEMFRAKGYRGAEKTAMSAIDWLSHTVVKQKNFFLWIHFNDLNKKMLPVSSGYTAQKEDSFQNENEFMDFLKINQKRNLAIFKSALLIPEDPTWETTDNDHYGLHGINNYDGALQSIDNQVKKVYEFIDANFENDSIWIITSDHGIGLGGHNHYGHFERIYNEQLRTPIIFYDTSRSYGTKIQQIAELADILPTIADYADFSLNNATTIQGQSLMPLIENSDSKIERSAFSFSPFTNLVSLQNTTFKYIVNYTDPSYEEFFNLKNDPLELENIAANPEFTEIKTQMKKEAMMIMSQRTPK